jgi:hypothetical protein
MVARLYWRAMIGRRSHVPPTRHVPSPGDVDAIAGCPHPVLRNLRITHAYHELSLAVADAVGPGANWCTFATWASKQAGQTIRAEDLGRKIEDVFAESEAVQLIVARIRRLRRAFHRPVDGNEVLRTLREACAPLLITARVADAIARGNKKVFEEIGREFARFLHVGAPAALDTFCAALRSGEPPDGQRFLAAAFRNYGRACSSTDQKARAEWMLLANLQIGFHEQTRLQPEIAESLNTCVPDPGVLKHRLVETLLPGEGTAASRRDTVIDAVAARVIERLRARIRAVITDELMTLELPSGRLRLARDVIGTFPERLLRLADPELTEFLRAVDRTPDTPLGSGADDWAELLDRMHFIADLFRTRHEDARLAAPPFSADQLRAMAQDRVPDGSL